MKRDAPLLLGLTSALIAVVLLACVIGPTPVPIHRVAAALMGLATAEENTVVQLIRLPRALAAALTGAALGASGAALQGLLRNPLAEPGVLGISAAASFGATLTIALGLTAFIPLAIPFGALAGALIGTGLIAYLAARTQSIITLILIGVALSSFLSALMSLMLSLSLSPLTMMDLLNWSFGSVANRSWQDIGLASVAMIPGFAILCLSRRDLSILTLGEEAAAAAGADLFSIRLKTVLGTGLITGGAVSLAGAIGFVGIIAPHIIRPWVGHDPSRILLPSAFAGAVMLVIADILIRILPTHTELRLGIALALVGAPLFALIASKHRRGP